MKHLGRLLAPLITVEESIIRWSSGGARRQTGTLFETTEPESPIDTDGEPLDEHEVKMIRAVVKLDQTTAREIMVPRVDMVAIESESSIPDVIELMVTGGHSRIPIYNSDLDHIEGIVHARDVLGVSGISSDHSKTSVNSKSVSGGARRQTGTLFETTEPESPIDTDGEPLDEHEVKMIRAVVKLDQTTAREIMVPRVDMVAIESESSIPDVIELMVTGGHSRIPIYNSDLDHIEGIVHARDVLGVSGISSDRGRCCKLISAWATCH